LLVADAWGRCAVLVSRLQGPPLLVELARAHGADSYGKLVLSPDEHELWHIDFRPPTLRRYALPSD
jgi:hypothetical protein